MFEDTLQRVATIKNREQEKIETVERVLVASEKQAISEGSSLALIRPERVSFKWKKRSASEIELVRSKFRSQMDQTSFLDKEVQAYEPCPFEFKMRYFDGDGEHNKVCGDWETPAAFYNLRRNYGEEGALNHLKEMYCEKYPQKGLVFALGNMASRPQTWQLLGMFPCGTSEQATLL